MEIKGLKLITDLIDAGYQGGGTNFGCGCSYDMWTKDGKLHNITITYCDDHVKPTKEALLAIDTLRPRS